MPKFMSSVGFLAVGIVIMMQIVHPAYAQSEGGGSSQWFADIPRCSKNIGVVSIVESEKKWWKKIDSNLGSPEALIRIFVQKSECFTLASASPAPDAVQSSSTLPIDEVKPDKQLDQMAEYYIIPDLIAGNEGSSGSSVGNVLARTLLFGAVGLATANINMKKPSRKVILYLRDVQTSEEIAAIEGHVLKNDIKGSERGDLFTGGYLVEGGAGSYAKTTQGKMLALAYLRAFTQMVNELGGMPSGK